MSFEERKRTYEGGAADMQMNNVTKKLKPEEILGGSGRDEPGKAVGRLLLNRAQFSRVIGKGGQTITHVRNVTGVFMKGSDVDEEYRLVLLSGSLDQVLNAFDMLTDLLQQAILADNANLPPNRPLNNDLSINLLLEHSKAGKAVGTKGTMMQNIKNKSGATSIRIEKEPMEINGVSLRKLTIEGSLTAVRRAHFLVQELYAEPQVLSNSSNYNAYNAGPTGSMDPMAGSPMGPGHPGHPMGRQMQPGYGNVPGGMGGYDGQGGAMDPSQGGPVSQMVPVPFPTLVNYGVQPETVRQLTEMKAYLWRHFGLDLSISREVLPPAGMHGGNPRPDSGNPYGANPYPQQQQPQQQGGGGGSNPSPTHARGNPSGRPSIESIIDARKQTNPTEVCFSIPRVAVGAIIGKGGQNLRDLQQQYGVRVYIEKEDFNGKRMVVLSYGGSGDAGGFDQQSMERTLHQCRDHIESIVDEQLKHQKESGSSDILIPE